MFSVLLSADLPSYKKTQEVASEQPEESHKASRSRSITLSKRLRRLSWVQMPRTGGEQLRRPVVLQPADAFVA